MQICIWSKNNEGKMVEQGGLHQRRLMMRNTYDEELSNGVYYITPPQRT